MSDDLKQPDPNTFVESVTTDSADLEARILEGRFHLHADYAFRSDVHIVLDDCLKRIKELEYQQTFEQAFIDRLIEEYSPAKMECRSLFIAIVGLRHQLKECRESEMWFRVHYLAMNLCGKHEQESDENDDGRCVFCRIEEKR